MRGIICGQNVVQTLMGEDTLYASTVIVVLVVLYAVHR